MTHRATWQVAPCGGARARRAKELSPRRTAVGKGVCEGRSPERGGRESLPPRSGAGLKRLVFPVLTHWAKFYRPSGEDSSKYPVGEAFLPAAPRFVSAALNRPAATALDTNVETAGRNARATKPSTSAAGRRPARHRQIGRASSRE